MPRVVVRPGRPTHGSPLRQTSRGVVFANALVRSLGSSTASGEAASPGRLAACNGPVREHFFLSPQARGARRHIDQARCKALARSEAKRHDADQQPATVGASLLHDRGVTCETRAHTSHIRCYSTSGSFRPCGPPMWFRAELSMGRVAHQRL